MEWTEQASLACTSEMWNTPPRPALHGSPSHARITPRRRFEPLGASRLAGCREALSLSRLHLAAIGVCTGCGVRLLRSLHRPPTKKADRLAISPRSRDDQGGLLTVSPSLLAWNLTTPSSQTFRKEHQQASNDSSPSQPSGPRSEPPLIISSPPTGSSSQPPTSTNGPAPQPSLNHHPSAPAETEALSVSSAFVHPSRLGMVNTAAPVTSSPPVKDDEQDLIVVEGSFKRQAPTQRAPLLTGSDAQSKATNAAVKTVEDAWASKRSSALSQRAESESSTSTPRRDSVVSRGSESPTKPSSSSTSTTMSSWDVSNFINQAVAGPFAPSYPSIAPASAPAEVRPPSTPSSEGLTRARSIHSSLPQKPYDIAVPYPTPNARSVPPPSPTRPRALLSIKGAGRSPTSPPTALNGSASTSAAPRGPRADQPKTNVLSVAGGAARQRATSWATSPPQPPTQPPQDQAEITSEPVKTAVNGAATVSDRPTSAPSAVAEQVVSSGDGPSSSSVDGMQAGKELSADVGDEGSGEGTGEKQAPVAEGDGQKAEKEVTMDVEEDK